MHHTELGILTTIREGIITSLKSRVRILEQRMTVISKQRSTNFRLPKGFFTDAAYITTAQHCSVCEVILAVGYDIFPPEVIVMWLRGCTTHGWIHTQKTTSPLSQLLKPSKMARY